MGLKCALLRAAERILPRVKFVLPANDHEYVGELDTTPSEFRQELLAVPNTYHAYLSSCKFVGHDSGTQIYEAGSYAHRPNGRFRSDWQYHVRFYDLPGSGIAVYCHREYNPWTAPRKHYRAVEWDGAAGVEWAREQFQALGP